MTPHPLQIGQQVRVRVGSAVRLATIVDIYSRLVRVRYDDVPAGWRTVPRGERAGMFGATVRPNAIISASGTGATADQLAWAERAWADYCAAEDAADVARDGIAAAQDAISAAATAWADYCAAHDAIAGMYAA